MSSCNEFSWFQEKKKKEKSVKERIIRFKVFQTLVIWQLLSAGKGHWTKPFLRQYCKQFYCVKRWTKPCASARFYAATHLRQGKTRTYVCMHPEKIPKHNKWKAKIPFSTPLSKLMRLLAAGLSFCGKLRCLWLKLTVTKLRLLGTSQHTALFSDGCDFTYQALNTGVEISHAAGLLQRRLLCSKIVHREMLGISENKAQGLNIIFPI